MSKYTAIILAIVLPLVLATTACTYDPESYEEQRQKANAEHDKQGY